jgi:hypothetical protein
VVGVDHHSAPSLISTPPPHTTFQPWTWSPLYTRRFHAPNSNAQLNFLNCQASLKCTSILFSKIQLPNNMRKGFCSFRLRWYLSECSVGIVLCLNTASKLMDKCQPIKRLVEETMPLSPFFHETGGKTCATCRLVDLEPRCGEVRT